MKYQTIKEWELEHFQEYPHWAYVWSYDGYGERWETSKWSEVQDYYEDRRKQSKEDYDRNAMWDFQFEPMVLLPTDDYPKWGDGVRLKYDWMGEKI